MSKKMRFFGMMLIALAVVGCTKPNDDNNNGGNTNSSVKVATSTPTDITCNSVSCGGVVFVNGSVTLTELGVCWGTSSNPTPADNKQSTKDCDQPYMCTIGNLTQGTNYHVRAFAFDGSKYYYGEDKAFTTLADNGGGGGNGEGTLSVSTNSITDITATGATCGGNVTVNGDVTVIARGVCWSTSSNPTIEQAHTTDGQGMGSFTSNITGLEENRIYYVRAYAQAGSIVEYGDEKSFSTIAAIHSEIQVTDVTYNSIKIKVTPSPDVKYYYSKLLGIGNPERHEASETELTFNNLSPETEYSLDFTFYDTIDNLLDNKQVNTTTSEQPYEPAYVTVTLINVTPTSLELKFEPSSNTAYYCFNVGGSLTSTSHQTGVTTKKFTTIRQNNKTYHFLPNTEYEFSVIAYDANGTASEIIHPRFKTLPAPYTDYLKVGERFYQLTTLQINKWITANPEIGCKDLFICNGTTPLVHIQYLCNWYETDLVWNSGTYHINSDATNFHNYFCTYGNNLNFDVTEGSFTIAKNGNVFTIDIREEANHQINYMVAHFSGIY